MIYEWKLDGEIRNFGDALHEILLTPNLHKEYMEDEKQMHFILGSVICNEVIFESLDQGYRPVFHNGCGWRGEPIEESIIGHCTFKGVRGPHTQEELARHGIETLITLDPGYEIPKLVRPGAPNGLAIVIRHILDDGEYNIDTMHAMKADALFTPVVQTRQDTIEMIQKISGARFILTGAMHAAIIAHAYNVPFALLASDYINCPPKWEDWMGSLGIRSPGFVDNVVEGRKWYTSMKDLL
jgi:hypothetical protein